MADRTASPPSLPPEAIEAITSKAPDAPRRCFICLTDASPSDPPNTWVDPCPCTLEAHQDCILSWVTDCERSNKPLRCPVCKSDIEMEGQWDPIVSLHDYVVKRFTRGSPWVLMSGLTFGLASGLQMYGAASIAVFAGREALLQMMLGDERTVDVTVPTGFTAERLRNGLFMMQIGPTLLMHRIFPSLVDTIVSPQVLLVCLVSFSAAWVLTPAVWCVPSQVRRELSALAAFAAARHRHFPHHSQGVLQHLLRVHPASRGAAQQATDGPPRRGSTEGAQPEQGRPAQRRGRRGRLPAEHHRRAGSRG